MVRIRRFGVIRTANVVAMLYVVIVAIFLVPIALLVLLAGASGTSPTGAAGAGVILAGGALVALLYGAVGWLFTAIACALYNLVAGWVGGIEIHLEAVEPPAVSPPPDWQAVRPPTQG